MTNNTNLALVKVRFNKFLCKVISEQDTRTKLFAKKEAVRYELLDTNSSETTDLRLLSKVPKEIRSLPDGYKRTTKFILWASKELGIDDAD